VTPNTRNPKFISTIWRDWQAISAPPPQPPEDENAQATLPSSLPQWSNITSSQNRFICQDSTPMFVGLPTASPSSKFPIPGPDGTASLVGGTAIDITEERRTRAVLEESEERFRSTFEQAAVGIAHVGLDGRWLRVNQKLCAIVGYPADELLARKFQDITHPEDLEADLAELRRLVAGEIETYSLEKRYFRKDHSLIWINLTVALVRTPEGQPKYLISVVEDITERKRVQDALAASESKYRNLFENMSEEVHFWQIVRDEQGRIRTWRLVDANPPTLETWGKSLDEVRGRTTDEIFGPGAADHYMPVVRKIMAEGVPHSFEDYFPHLGRHFRFTSVPLGDHFITTGADVTDAKNAQNRLRESEGRVRAVLESITDAFFAVGHDWRFTYVNPQAEQLLSRTPGDLLGASLWDAYPGLVGSEFERVYRQVMVGRAAASLTAFYPDHERWYEVRVYPAEGGISIYFRDVSERVRSEQALRASEAGRRLALDSAELGTWHLDVATGALDTDERFRAIFGVTSPCLGFEDGIALIHPDDRLRVRDAVAAATRTDDPAPFAVEYRVVRPDGEVRWVLSRGRANPEEGTGGRRLVSLDGTITDVTARKEGEERLRASEERFRTLFERMDEGYCVIEMIFDPPGGDRAVDYRFLEVNPAFEAQAGMRDATGRRMREFVADIEEHWLENYGRVALTGEPVRFANEYTGLNRWFEVYAFRIGGAGSRRVGVLFTDVTLRKRAEEDRERLVGQLRDADRRKDEFLATLAHELRNPLAPIRNGLQVMKLASGNAVAVERAREMMERQLTQMVRLVDDLLDVSRITRGKLELRKERIALANVVQNAVEGSRPIIEAAAHELTVRLPSEPVYLDGDPTRLAQVFSNLLTNAAKYTDRGGHIWLTAVRQGRDVVVSVRDTGIGIASEHLPRLFEMFSQVDSALERSQGGLGIGLSLVKGLVEMHGGTVEVRSEGLGKGSEFIIRLPAEGDPAAAATRDRDGRDMSPRSTKRVLVADDNRDAADSLAMVLRLAGHEVHAVHDGQEAVDAVAWFRPDLVLLDLGMPRLNGFDAARRIREQPWGAKTVLAAITGWGQEDDRRRSKEAGFDSHLVKPVDPAALEKLLDGVPSVTE
jgi:PAS domain S-box-containing protein